MNRQARVSVRSRLGFTSRSFDRLLCFLLARPIVGWVLTAVCNTPESYRTTVRASTKPGPASLPIDDRFLLAASRLSRIFLAVGSTTPLNFEKRAFALSGARRLQCT